MRSTMQRGFVKKYSSRLVLVLLVVFCAACHETAISTKPESTPSRGAEPARPQETETNEVFLEFMVAEKLDWMAKAWKRFTADGRYRIAKREDFAQEVRDMMQYSYERTAISHEHGYDDFAIVVVDMKQTDPNRFGLIVFNAPKDGRTTPELHWVYRDRDLTRTVFRKWSGGIILSQYGKDGAQENCYLNWQRAKKRYSCDQDYDGSHLGLPKSKSNRPE